MLNCKVEVVLWVLNRASAVGEKRRFGRRSIISGPWHGGGKVVVAEVGAPSWIIVE